MQLELLAAGRGEGLLLLSPEARQQVVEGDGVRLRGVVRGCGGGGGGCVRRVVEEDAASCDAACRVPVVDAEGRGGGFGGDVGACGAVVPELLFLVAEVAEAVPLGAALGVECDLGWVCLVRWTFLFTAGRLVWC